MLALSYFWCLEVGVRETKLLSGSEYIENFICHFCFQKMNDSYRHLRLVHFPDLMSNSEVKKALKIAIESSKK